MEAINVGAVIALVAARDPQTADVLTQQARGDLGQVAQSETLARAARALSPGRWIVEPHIGHPERCSSCDQPIRNGDMSARSRASANFRHATCAAVHPGAFRGRSEHHAVAWLVARYPQLAS